jgi:hypothetical protein
MRRRIGNNIYNTETSKLICRNRQGKESRDTTLVLELYKTRRGSFFLHLQGGCNTRAAAGQLTAPGEYESIEQISRAEAYEFAERIIDKDALRDEFAVPSGSEKVQLLVLVPSDLRDTLRALAKQKGKSISEIVNELLVDYVKADEEQQQH